MADAVPYSDEDNYANESFENDSDTDIPEISDSEDESFSKNNKTKALYAYTRNHIIGNDSLDNTDLVRYTSSSDDEDDVVISETIAEINTEPASTRTTAESTNTVEAMQILEEEFPNALMIAESIDIVKLTRLETDYKLYKEKQEIEDLSTSVKHDLKMNEIELQEETLVSENSMKPHIVLNNADKNEHQTTDLTIKSKELPTMNSEKEDINVNLESSRDTESTNRELSVITETESINDTDDSNFECHITSNTPTSFNTEDYAFHLEFLKRSSCSNKVRVHRKSWTFTNERMREIERQNHILLKKILTQKPTYTTSNSKPIQPKISNLPPGIRMTSSAVNRRKQQRQIDMDNQVLWRKLQAISGRRPMV
ncbi:protein hemingway [Teleopsis dalmanni]|uniref:protein hemingway n=1 Tax=Teleopsis dalmanni TaxID=139649 RepID=UPI0018CD56CF|nr:protein hemingway [Teleopsis dalmanni]